MKSPVRVEYHSLQLPIEVQFDTELSNNNCWKFSAFGITICEKTKAKALKLLERRLSAKTLTHQENDNANEL